MFGRFFVLSGCEYHNIMVLTSQRDEKMAKHHKILKIEYLLIESVFLSQVKEFGIRKN